VSLKKEKSQGKAVEVTVNIKDENSSDFCLDVYREFGLWTVLILLMSLLPASSMRTEMEKS
jgi:hypothetical protein